jgi:hypothetical protein
MVKMGFFSDHLVLNSTMSAANYCIGASDMFDASTKKILTDRIPDLNADKITAGTISIDRIPTLTAAKIPDLDAAKIATGTISNDRIVLTTTKLYQNFNKTNFAIIDDKIDLPPTYSFNITGYDSPTLYSASTDKKLKGKMSASYDDRKGVYKLASINTNNVSILNYSPGDKICIKNTADCSKDFIQNTTLQNTVSKKFMRLALYKLPSNIPFNKDVGTNFTAILFEWTSSDNANPIVWDFRAPYQTFPFTTIMSFIVEEGFNYYLIKFWIEDFVETGIGDDYNDFNRSHGAGQTFKFLSSYTVTEKDYLPKSYSTPDTRGYCSITDRTRAC